MSCHNCGRNCRPISVMACESCALTPPVKELTALRKVAAAARKVVEHIEDHYHSEGDDLEAALTELDALEGEKG